MRVVVTGEPASGAGRIVLIRHGRTALNATGLKLGRQDPPLDEIGQAQAGAVATRIAAERVDAVWSSPLRRSVDTATAIAARHGLAVEIVPDLVEMDYGTADPTGKLKLKERHAHVPLPGGESLGDVWRRVAPIATSLRDRLRAGDHIVVVGHYRANQLLASALTGADFATALDDPSHRPSNASVHELVFRNGTAYRPVLLWEPPDGS